MNIQTAAKTMELRKNVPADELTYAAQMCKGKNDMANVIKEITKSPIRAPKFRKAVAKSIKETTATPHSVSKAVTIFVEARLITTKQYTVIQQASKNVFPCYSILQKVKKE